MTNNQTKQNFKKEFVDLLPSIKLRKEFLEKDIDYIPLTKKTKYTVVSVVEVLEELIKLAKKYDLK